MQTKQRPQTDQSTDAAKGAKAHDNVVTVRVTDDELVRLDRARALVRLKRGPYLRRAALDKLPNVVPELNREAWGSLVLAMEHLTGVSDWLESNEVVERADIDAALTAIAASLSCVRRHILGLPNASNKEQRDEG